MGALKKASVRNSGKTVTEGKLTVLTVCHSEPEGFHIFLRLLLYFISEISIFGNRSIKQRTVMKYYIKRKNKPQGPYTKEDLRKRMLKPSTLIHDESSELWVRADQCKELEDVIVPAPNTWFLASVLTLFICLPFGIVGLLKAYQIQDLYRTGKITEARVMSQETARWIKIGIACGLIIYVMVLAFHGAAIIKTLGIEKGFF